MQLEAKGVGFRYQNQPWLLRNVDLSLKAGEIVGLTGPSGQGKTTMCRILAGIEQPLEGEVSLSGLTVPKRGYHPVQLIFQHPEKAVNPRLKMGKTLNEAGQIDQEQLDLLGIKREWLTRYPNELSGGELQRFCVARALGEKTKFLIADEITTMLDGVTQAQIWSAILETVKKQKMGLLVVSHDSELIKRLCQRVVSI